MATHTFDPKKAMAILIGISNYTEDFHPIKPAAHNVARLAGILADPGIFGLPPDRVISIVDESSSAIKKRLIKIGDQVKENKLQTLLLYYTGHGYRHTKGDYYLATTDTEKDQINLDGSTALAYATLKSILQKSGVPQSIVILDACYSGLATQAGENLLPDLDLKGNFTLASSDSHEVSYFDTDQNHTLFTGELLELLERGLPSARDRVSLKDLYEALHAAVKRKNSNMTPQQQSGKGLLPDSYYFFKNKHFDPEGEKARQIEEEILNGADILAQGKVDQAKRYFMGLEREVEQEITRENLRHDLLSQIREKIEFCIFYLRHRVFLAQVFQVETGKESAKIQTEARLLRTEIDTLRATIKNLEAEVKEKDRTIAQLEKENRSANETVKQLRKEKAILEQQLKKAKEETKHLVENAITESFELLEKAKIIQVPAFILEMEKRVKDLKENKNQAVKDQQYEKASDLRDQESKLLRQLEFARMQWIEDVQSRFQSPPKSESLPVFKMPEIADGMIRIKGGPFDMGDVMGDNHETDETVHRVTVGDFYLGQYPVTVGEFKLFVEESGYQTLAEIDGGSYFYENAEWKKKEGINWRHNEKGQLRPPVEYDHPVLHVSWYDAVEYCNWRSRKEGLEPAYDMVKTRKDDNNTSADDPFKWVVTCKWKANPPAGKAIGYRLPTEAEWEFAARAPTGKPEGGKKVRFGNGKDIADPEEINFAGSKEYKQPYSVVGEYRGRTVPVGSLKCPNGLGLHDMSGNVREWCWDWYAEYPTAAQENPHGPDKGSHRVYRGGGWGHVPEACRTASRTYWGPARRLSLVGFRLARS